MGHAVAEISEDASLTTPRITAGAWMVLGVLLMGEFVILLDTTIMEVAIPNLLSDLKSSFDEVLWVLNAYLLIFAVLMITFGRLGDMVGPKRLFILGMAIFTAGSVACMVAPNVQLLIAFRVLQGLGAAIMTPQPGTIIMHVFPPEKRGAAFGIMGATIGLAAVTGPSLGGALTSGFTWRAIFVPNIPVGVLAIILGYLMVPDVVSHRERRLDIVGIMLSTAGLVAGVYGLLEGQKYGWGRIRDIGSFDLGPIHGSLISIPTILLASGVFLIAFVIWEARQEEPLLPLSLFRDRNFSIGNLACCMVTFGLVGQMIILLLFLQTVRGLTPIEAGIAVVPNALFVMMAAPIAGKLSERVNGKYLLFVGFLLYAAGLYLIIRVASLSATGLSFFGPLAMTGFGMGLTISPMAAMTMQFVAPSAVGAASGFLNTVRQVGATLGAAVVGAVFQAQLATQLPTQARNYASQIFTQYNADIQAGFIKGFTDAAKGGLQIGPGQKGGVQLFQGIPPMQPVINQLAALATVVVNHAFLSAMRPALAVPVGAALVTACFTFLMRSQRAVPAFATAPQPGPDAAAAPSILPMPTPIQLSDTMVLAVPVVAQTMRSRAVQPLVTPYLVASGNGNQYPIGGTFTIGRLPNLSLVVDDPKVSRRHAEIVPSDGQARLRDLRSANGTMVNGKLIEGDHMLREGDMITVGGASFVYHAPVRVQRPRLLATTGKGVHEYPITQTIILGRSSSNDIVVDDPRASRRHAAVNSRNGQTVLRDLASLNGTRVNGELVMGDRALQDGNTITIGDAAFVYRET